jgi:hypothetical protein
MQRGLIRKGGGVFAGFYGNSKCLVEVSVSQQLLLYIVRAILVTIYH